jgi:hypothetical protein
MGGHSFIYVPRVCIFDTAIYIKNPIRMFILPKNMLFYASVCSTNKINLV